jgi:hypothetical protein
MPLIVGAVAVAIIATEKNAGTTKIRLSDSANAQITSAYFVPDVQGAQFVTTTPNVPQPYSVTAPQVCGSGTGTTLLLGLFRPGTSTAPLMSVGYWLTTANGSSSVIRYSCTVGPPFFNATVRTKVVISDDVNAATQTLATITPNRFAQTAAKVWAPVAISTSLTADTVIPVTGPWSMPVTLATGFDISQPITVTTATGLLSVTCTGPLPTLSNTTIEGPGTSFAGCSGTGTTPMNALHNTPVTQPAGISSVGLSVYEPGSSYTYRLAGVPRAYPIIGSSAGGPNGAPALLTLNGTDTVQGGTNAKLQVNGVFNINTGTLTCTGGPYVRAYVYAAPSGSSQFDTNCANGGPTVTQPAIPDPYTNIAPTYPSPQFLQQPLRNSVPPSGVCLPGEYTVAFTCSSLQPGVYVLDQGLGGNSIAMATGAPPGKGVLLYLPCLASPCTENVNMGGHQTITLPGLNASQSVATFGTSAMQGLVLWQDKANAAPAYIGGTSSAVTLSGTMYFPNAKVSLYGGGTGGPNNYNVTAGRIIAKQIYVDGSSNALISP